ncbi:MAG: protein kinase [Bryobacterales bacterium]|nr:protein kinase [Bryobacterales bacterium]
MNASRWESIKTAFLHVSSLPEESREGFLAGLRAADAEVAGAVDDLLSETPDDDVLDIRRPCWSVVTFGATAEPAAASLAAGTVLAERFEITFPLGSGGAGEVYRAFDRAQRDFVALKVLRRDVVADRSAAQSLRKEVHTARQVTHPNVCRLHEFYPEEPGRPPFLTMELLVGRTLRDRLEAEGPYSAEQAEPLVRQMIAGLECAHERGIVHRDFKPGNVMLVDGERRAVLMDFGLARDLIPGRDLSATITGSGFAGTPSYMAPEQLQGKAATPAADIHALGVVLFEMLTGGRPFTGSTPVDAAAQRLSNDAPCPRVDGRRLDRRWERLILCCLERDALRRPQTAAEVRALLDNPVPVFWGRRRLFRAAGGVGIAAAMGAGVTAWPKLGRKAREREEAALAQYLRASKLLEEFSPASARAALAALDEALRLNPQYALAMAAKADAHLYLSRVDSGNRASHLADARQAAGRAVRLDPQLADAHTSQAAVHQADWRWREAEGSYRQALALRPAMARAHRWYCGLLLQFGRVEEALEHARRSVELDPHDRAVPGTIGFYYFLAGDNQKALETLEPAVRELDSAGRSDSTRFNLAQVYAWSGAQHQGAAARDYFAKALRQAEIIRAFEQSRGQAGPALSDQIFALIYVLRGENGKAAPYVKRVEADYAQRRIWVLPLAWVYALRGETEAAVTLLEQARQEHDAGLLYVKVMPLLRNLHGNPRFGALLEEMGLNHIKER